MCKYLASNGYTPIVLDNLVHGHREAVKWGPFIEGNIADSELLRHIILHYDIADVMHFAAFCYVGESVVAPAKYYQNNVADTINLLQSLVENNVRHFIFSSSCAVYGEPAEIPITEKHPQNPINPYGQSKLMVERLLADFQSAYGLQSVSLRYFNAAGSDFDGELGEDHNPEPHLIPLVLQVALGQKDNLDIYGEDYPTEDGTCIRDYIHVYDIAQAHLLALERLVDGHSGSVYNLGNGNGYSINQVTEIVRKITKHPIPLKVTKRRHGDPGILVGASRKARNELGWNPDFSDLPTIIETAWKWHKSHPNGYLS